MSATITLNDKAISQIAEALAPHIESIIETRLRRRERIAGEGRRMLRAKAVMQLTGMGRSALYRDPTFPKQIKIGERMVAWAEDEVLDWMAAKKAARD